MLTSQTITLFPISVVFTVNQNSLEKKDLSREMERKKERGREKGAGGSCMKYKFKGLLRLLFLSAPTDIHTFTGLYL